MQIYFEMNNKWVFSQRVLIFSNFFLFSILVAFLISVFTRRVLVDKRQLDMNAFWYYLNWRVGNIGMYKLLMVITLLF